MGCVPPWKGRLTAMDDCLDHHRAWGVPMPGDSQGWRRGSFFSSAEDLIEEAIWVQAVLPPAMPYYGVQSTPAG